MKRDEGTIDIIFGIEHRMRKDEMEEQFSKEAKQGWRCAADAARITVENASSEGRQAHVGRSLCSYRQQSGNSHRHGRRTSHVDSRK